MTTQQSALTPRPVNFSASYRWHPAFAALILVIAHIGASVLAQRHNPAGPVHGDASVAIILILLFTLVLLSLEGGALIVSVYRRKLQTAIWQALTIAILVGSMVFGREIVWAVRYVDLFAFSSEFKSCENDARSYDKNAKFNLCSAQSFGSSYSVVVYDSGNQIKLPSAQQKQSFKGMLATLKSPLLSECISSPGRHLYDSFYLVDSECDR